MSGSDPRDLWRLDPDAAAAEDLDLGRGVLIAGPEHFDDGADAHGGLAEIDGSEYRILIEDGPWSSAVRAIQISGAVWRSRAHRKNSGT